ncbi:hypothetical protein [Senegalia massiliensis]|uniref:Uncharacterized protein n=1 Tax=Senegalia massiliensis TaxID=1720316 RepID=A0A845QZS0_9CLOT|nr:hypothetical protein [Senegalia massiliensis]NBI06688.1 hypothetical protein [Senegalia massiliensis]
MQKEKILATYKTGNSICHILEPDPELDQEKVKEEMRRVGWQIWNSLSYEDKIRINAKYED